MPKHCQPWSSVLSIAHWIVATIVGAIILTCCPAGPAWCQQAKPATVRSQNAEGTSKSSLEKPDQPSPALNPLDDAKAVQAARYWRVLQRRPRQGTAFDLWYRLYLDGGKLNTLVAFLESEIHRSPNQSAPRLLLALVHQRMGQLQRAQRELETVARQSPDDAYPRGLLAEIHEGRGQVAAASAAYREALRRKPPRTDLLELYKKLGRLELRRGNTASALAVWEELLQQFPRDRRVLEELAELLAEERQYDDAIDRWTEFKELSAGDHFGRLRASLAIAQLHGEAGRRDQAVRHYEQALKRVKPDSWQARDIRNQILRVYRTANNLEGYLTYVGKKIEAAPDDVAMRLQRASVLNSLGRFDTATADVRHAAQLRPRDRRVQMQWIAQLRSTDNTKEAVTAARALSAQLPKDRSLLKLLGQLLLERDRGDRQQREAIEIWERIDAADADDPGTAVQVAELCRQAAGLGDSSQATANVRLAQPPDSPLLLAAEKWYREATRRAPDISQYHEYLGEFLHAKGQADQARAAWQEMVAPPLDTAAQWHRLSEVLARFGYLSQAAAASAASVEKDPTQFAFQRQQVALLVRLRQFDTAQDKLDGLIDGAALRPADRRSIYRLVVQSAGGSGRLGEAIQRQRARLTKAKTAGDYWLLSLLLEQNWQIKDALQAMSTAAKMAADDVDVIRHYAAVLQQAGNNSASIAQWERVLKLDPKRRNECYERLVELRIEQDDLAEAEKTIDRWLTASVRQIPPLLIKARLARRRGDAEGVVSSLRSAVDLEPRNTDVRRQLAAALEQTNRAAEAIEIMWQCITTSTKLEEQLGLATSLASMAKRNGLGESIQQRWRRKLKASPTDTAIAFAFAEFMRGIGQPREARGVLSRIHARRPNDVAVLQRMSSLAETEKDINGAIEYQTRLIQIQPSGKALGRLARMYESRGFWSRATDAWNRVIALAANDKEVCEVVDSWLRAARFEEALRGIDRGLERFPDSWRLQYRRGYGHIGKRRWQDASDALKQMLALPEMQQLRPSFLQRSQADVRPLTMAAPTTAARFLPSPQINASHDELQWAGAGLQRFLLGKAATPRSGGSSAPKSPAAQRARWKHFVIPLPTNRLAAQIDGAAMLMQCDREQGLYPNWKTFMLDQSQKDPQLLRVLVMIESASNKLVWNDPLLKQLQEKVAVDPLPHLIRTQFVGKHRRWNTLPLARQQEIASQLPESFRWLSQHQPRLVSLVLVNHFLNLSELGRGDEALVLVSQYLPKFETLEQLAMLPVSEFDASVETLMLRRAIDLSRDPANRQSVSVLEKILEQAAQRQLIRANDDSLKALSELLANYLAHSTRPTSITARGLTSAQQKTALYMARIRFVQRHLTTLRASTSPQARAVLGTQVERQKSIALDYRTSQKKKALTALSLAFPSPNKWLPAEQFVLLEELLEACGSRPRRQIVLDALRAVPDPVSADGRQVLTLAELYVQWWMGDTQPALQQLEQISRRAQSDATYKIQLAVAYLNANDLSQAWETIKLLDGASDERTRAIAAELRSEVLRR